MDHRSALQPRELRGRWQGSARTSPHGGLVAVWLGALLALLASLILSWELMAESRGSVQWGEFSAETVSCRWGSCSAVGSWRSADNATRLENVRLDGDFAVGQRVPAGVRTSGIGAGAHAGAVLVTERSQAARLLVLALAMLTTLGLAGAIPVAEAVRGRSTPPGGRAAAVER
nr:hypothetical protein [Propionicimonas sp.]